jgi:hypothetical protein
MKYVPIFSSGLHYSIIQMFVMDLNLMNLLKREVPFNVYKNLMNLNGLF